MKKDRSMDEYNALRAELVAKQERKAQVWLHMYILYISLFVLSVDKNRYGLLLLTFVVLIPYQEVINNLEWNVSRISAYIREFYEDETSAQRWETMNPTYKPYTEFLQNQKVNTLSGFVRRAGSIHLGLLSTGFYIGNVVTKHFECGTLQKLTLMELAGMLLAVILLAFVVYENQSSKQKCEQELKDIIADYKKECDKQTETICTIDKEVEKQDF